mgnify:CR=1 FL=1
MVLPLTITLAQLNATVGDLNGNASKVVDVWKAEPPETDLIVFPETFLSGYPPDDLVLKPAFMDQVEKTVEQLLRDVRELKPAALLPSPWRQDDGIYNAALLIEDGDVTEIILKQVLPNYDIFDDKRLFSPGPQQPPITFRGHKLGVCICEDIWTPGVVAHLAEAGAEALIVPNGSPYELYKHQRRLDTISARVKETGLSLYYLNLVGGQDELIFDGQSLVMNAEQTITHQAPAFQEDVMRISATSSIDLTSGLPETEELYAAAMLGLRDYVTKTGFERVLLGLSGGIDSALCAALACDALGPDKVHAIMMPSRFTSETSLRDAGSCARALRVTYDEIPIGMPVTAMEQTITELKGVAHENMQSRLRGLILMSLSNQDGALVLSTGNKSELAVGYATLYGDMCGAYNPIKDLYKNQVYQLAKWRNETKPSDALGPSGKIIPESIIAKAPTAELREHQKDSDSLPPYEVLDAILKLYIDEDAGAADIIEAGFTEATVHDVISLVRRSEYKRRQAPPGPKLSRKAFIARDRRYPIINGFEG